MKVGVIVAMDKEFACINSFLDLKNEKQIASRTFVKGRVLDNEIILTKSGIGKVNAAISTTLLAQNFFPDVIISTGVAAGASTTLSICDVVVATKVCYHDVFCDEFFVNTQTNDDQSKASEQEYQTECFPICFKTDENLVKKAQEATSNVSSFAGLIVTGDRFIEGQVAMINILKAFPYALAVDMESAAIAQTCHVFNIPFLSFRVISDIPLTGNSIEMYKNFWEKAGIRSFQITKNLLENL